jgi:Protein-tyrosine-phosphatase
LLSWTMFRKKKETTENEKIRILFVDETNELQSQIAEFFLKEFYGDVYEACSAGAHFDHMDCELISSMYQIGYDIRQYRAKDFRSKQILKEYDYLVFLQQETYDRIKDIAPYTCKKVMGKDFGTRKDLKATDDKELFEAYKQLVAQVGEWVKETFRDPSALEGM